MLSWYSLLPGEAKSALHRPVTIVVAGWFLLTGIVFAAILAPTGSILVTAVRGFVLGLEYAAIPAILLGTAVGGEDDDLRTKRDVWLAGISPANLLIAKFVIAVDLVVLSSSLLFVGGAVVGLFAHVLGAPAGGTISGASLSHAFSMLVLVLPFMVTASALTSAILHSRLGGVIVWLALFAFHVGSRALPASFWLAHVVKLLPIGSVSALATGYALPGVARTAMRWWVALIISVAWLLILGLLAATRWRVATAQGASARRTSRPIRWRMHATAAGLLVVGLAVAGCLLPDRLVSLGISHDPVYQTLTNNRARDYLKRVADMLEAGDYRAAESYVGPAGSDGLVAIMREMNRSGGSCRLIVGNTGEGGKLYPSLSLETTKQEPNGPAEIVLGDDFIFELDFERGSWRVLEIRKATW